MKVSGVAVEADILAVLLLLLLSLLLFSNTSSRAVFITAYDHLVTMQ